MAIDLSQTFTQFAGNLPAFIAIILASMNSNSRLSDVKSEVNARFSDLDARVSDLRSERRSDSVATRELLRAQFKRVEEVMDARITRLEAREP